MSTDAKRDIESLKTTIVGLESHSRRAETPAGRRSLPPDDEPESWRSVSVSEPSTWDDWDDDPYEEVVAEIEVTPRSRILARVYEWHLELRFDIRVFAQRKDGSWGPTKRGLSVRKEKLPDLVKAVQKLVEAATSK